MPIHSLILAGIAARQKVPPHRLRKAGIVAGRRTPTDALKQRRDAPCTAFRCEGADDGTQGTTSTHLLKWQGLGTRRPAAEVAIAEPPPAAAVGRGSLDPPPRSVVDRTFPRRRASRVLRWSPKREMTVWGVSPLHGRERCESFDRDTGLAAQR
eukprot:Polyplicarium_translucidae@DN594_c0_g1_i1.p2